MSSTSAVPLHSKAASPAEVEALPVVRTWLFDTSVDLLYRPNVVEAERRREHGLGHIDSLELLDVLMDLPADLPVPLYRLNGAVRRVLQRAPAGIVDLQSETVVRRAVPAVTPVVALIQTVQWRSGLVRASRFAAYCARTVVLRKLPANHDKALAEASWYGIGVAVGSKDTHTTVLEPEPLTDWQPTPAWWHFSESIYAEVLRNR